jgi:hypothetical protein
MKSNIFRNFKIFKNNLFHYKGELTVIKKKLKNK